MIDYKTAQEVIVTNQTEMNAIPLDYKGRIIIKADQQITVRNRYYRSVEARDNSSVEARENSSVEARENSSVVAWWNSSVVAWGNSSVEALGNSSVVARANSSVVAWWNAQVLDRTLTHHITVSGNARIVYDPRTPKEYADHIGAAVSDGKIRLYKAVHKQDGRYRSNFNKSFEYIIGNIVEADSLTTVTTEDCGHGIHAASVEWCLNYGDGWPDLAILEVEMDLDGLVVPVGGAGKVRAAKCRVIREVPLEECGLYGRILARRRKE